MLPNQFLMLFTVQKLRSLTKVKAEEYPDFIANFLFVCFHHFIFQNHYWERPFLPFWMHNACMLCRALSAKILLIMILFAHLLFKSQSFQQLQQNPLMPTCQRLPCTNLEIPFLQLSQFHPAPAGRCLVENSEAVKTAHDPVQVHGLLLLVCKWRETPFSLALEAVQLGVPVAVLTSILLTVY